MAEDTDMNDDGSPLITDAKNLYNRFSSAMKAIPGKGLPSQPVDTTWHDQQVDEANKSFQKPAPQKSDTEPTTTTRKIIRKAPIKR